MRRAWLIVTSLAVLSLGFTVGCGGKKPESENTMAAPAKPAGPNFQEFAALPTATMKISVPFVMTEEGGVSETPCLKSVEGVAPVSANLEMRDLIERHRKEVAEAVRNWISEELRPDGVNSVMTGGWTIEVEDPVMMAVGADGVRLVDGQECIAPDRGWLPEGQHIINLVLGAKTLKFEASIPVDADGKEGLMKAAGMENIAMESPSLFIYEPAKDKKGELMKNPDGIQMYTSPSGVLIKESDVPPPEQQLMKEWTFKFDKPLWFAVRELSNDDWRRESKKDVCDVNLIWGDVTPRAPECEEFNESAFTAMKDENGNVVVTITTGDQNKGVTLPFNKAEMVQVDDRIILWLSPKEIEEGVLIRLNSLVIDPSSMGGKANKKGKNDVPIKTTYAKPDKDEDAKDLGKGKGKDKGKGKGQDKGKDKGKDTPKKSDSGNALDDYLFQ